MNAVTVSLCQLKVDADKQKSLDKARQMINHAANLGAQIVMLPEMFNCPYDINCFLNYAEELPAGETARMLAELARSKRIYLIGGSIPELAGRDLYNTCLVFDPDGQLVGKHRKVHLFDVQVKNGIQFRESAVLKAGDNLTLVDTPWGKIGIMICYDIRFPEFARKLASSGAKIICVPAAFNLTTGPAHWDTLFKSRALDNQVFFLGNSPARDESASYIAYGHSLAVNPWGQIIGQLDESEGLLTVELDLDQIEEVRQALPVWQQLRPELY